MKSYGSISIACVEDGKGVQSVVKYYLANNESTGVTVSTPGWDTTIQTASKDKKYLWCYEVTTYTDGSTTTINPFILSIYNKKIVEVKAQYYCSTDNKELIGGNWSDEPSSWNSGDTVFVKYITLYDDGTDSETSPVVDETFTTISDWCINNDKTLINGANIATGTITADHIKSKILQSTNGNLIIDLNNGTISTLVQSSIRVDLRALDTIFFGSDEHGYSPPQITLTASAVDDVGKQWMGDYIWYKDGEQIDNNEKKTLVVWPSDIKDGEKSIYTVSCPAGDVSFSDSVEIGKNISVQAHFSCDSIVLELNENEMLDERTYEDESGNLVGTGLGYDNQLTHSVYRYDMENGEVIRSKLRSCATVDEVDGDLDKYYIEVYDNTTSLTVEKEVVEDVFRVEWFRITHEPSTPKVGTISFRIYYYDGTKTSYINKNLTVRANHGDAVIGAFSLIMDSDSGTVTPASLILGINRNGDSTVKIEADSISLEGVVTANNDFQINTDGSMIATGGTIGGWTINDSSLYRPYEGQYEETGSGWNKTKMHYGGVGFKVSSASPTDPILWAGYTGSTAEDGDGTPWGAAKVDSSRKWTDYTKFWVDNTGHVYAKGGEIGGCKIVDGVLQVSNANITTGLDANKITTGTLSANRIDTDNLYIRGENITTMVEEARNANFSSSAGSTGYVTSGGTGIASGVNIAGSSGAFKVMDGCAAIAYGNVYVGAGVSASILYGGGVYARAASSGGTLYGTWQLSGGEAVTSDRNKKNSINDLTYRYDKLFDELRPVSFKYNDGTSNRTHTGFIAQDVCSAVEASGMDTDDFAAYLKFTDTNIKTGEESEISCLRYSEFVSLNTWQIQKCKKRISDLEAKIAELEEKIDRNEE